MHILCIEKSRSMLYYFENLYRDSYKMKSVISNHQSIGSDL